MNMKKITFLMISIVAILQVKSLDQLRAQESKDMEVIMAPDDSSAFLIKNNAKDEVFRVQANGRVGIGTTDPTSDLEVFSEKSAKVRITSDSSLEGSILELTNNNPDSLQPLGSIDFFLSTRKLGGISYTALNAMNFLTNNETSMSIDQKGTVRVRETLVVEGNDRENLVVNGGISTNTGFIVKNLAGVNGTVTFSGSFSGDVTRAPSTGDITMVISGGIITSVKVDKVDPVFILLNKQK